MFEYGVKKVLDLNNKFVQRGEEKDLNGKYTMLIGYTDQHDGRGNVDIDWMDPRKNKLKLDGHSKYQEICNGSKMDWCFSIGWLNFISNTV